MRAKSVHHIFRPVVPVAACIFFCVATEVVAGPGSIYLIPVSPGWNLLSLPASVGNGCCRELFPSAVSPAYEFHYSTGYVSCDSLHAGRGFWLKFAGADTIEVSGDDIILDSIQCHAGWNIIGSISSPLDTGWIVTNPPGIISSEFFGYVPGAGYQQTDSLYPGAGCWVKLRQDGVIVLTKPGIPCPGTPVVDYAGKTYTTVLIGMQCWLRENLDVGTRIPGAQNQSDNSVIEKYCYNNDTANCTTYGALYQWDEAMQYQTAAGVQGICPPGWHLPTLTEYVTLRGIVSDDGNALKAVGQGSGSGAGTNTTGFSALLTGVRFSYGFFYIGEFGDIWSSTQFSSTYAYDLTLVDGAPGISNATNPKALGFGVRCLKD